jgi:cobalt-zinc-cadmium efflux system protein
MNALPAQHEHGGHAPHRHLSARAERSRRRLLIVLALTALYMLAEAFGGWFTGSLALLADAGHMLTDVAALALALMAVWFGVALVVMALLIFYQAYERWHDPREVESNLMIVIAAGGLAINLACAWLLHGDHHDDLNLHGAWLHIMGDALGSVGAIIAGVLMSAYGWYRADALFSAGIALLIVWSSWHLIKESTNVLLEGTPAHINLASVEEVIRTTEGVEGVHDLHVWTITSGREALSAHVVHAHTVVQPELLKELRVKLHDRFGVDHLTLQMETEDFEDETFHFCHAGTACFSSGKE